MFLLARQMQPPVIVTATTHLGAWQVEFADQHVVADSLAALESVEHGLKGIVLVTGALDGNRTRPIAESMLDRLHQFCGYHSIPLLIEADGSRQKPLKAWSDHEPPIPEFSDAVAQVAGLSGLDKPLTDEYVHRAEIFSGLCGLEIGETVTTGALARVLTDPRGGLKNVPARARRILLLNQADSAERQAAALAMTSSLLRVHHSVIIASLKDGIVHAVHESIAGIVLAAGESSRFGEPKQLLDWKGQSFVRAVTQTALKAGLSPVVVVTGANAEEVEAAVNDLDVIVARNEEWQSGQGSSIRAGVLSLTPTSTLGFDSPDEHGLLQRPVVGGAVFLLADQPQITISIIQALMEKHAEGLHPIVAPMVMDRRANPVLFDRAVFPDLLTIEGDVGGRAIFHKHRVEYLPWHDDRLLLDVDTPEQYRRLASNGDV
ncbi:MAG: putative selenium-dependent hydroxylase accessory protein YqeC [Anaerolineales bacterium]|nr:putative selenium-dependent hydroxylase accessory protein YqeC [Anaerolineales bacterium]